MLDTFAAFLSCIGALGKGAWYNAPVSVAFASFFLGDISAFDYCTSSPFAVALTCPAFDCKAFALFNRTPDSTSVRSALASCFCKLGAVWNLASRTASVLQAFITGRNRGGAPFDRAPKVTTMIFALAPVHRGVFAVFYIAGNFFLFVLDAFAIVDSKFQASVRGAWSFAHLLASVLFALALN
jgi:hypothetical protein